MKQVSINEEQEQIDFAKRAAECFTDNSRMSSFTGGEVEPDCLLALRWGLGNDCVLVLKLNESHTPTIYRQLIPMPKPVNDSLECASDPYLKLMTRLSEIGMCANDLSAQGGRINQAAAGAINCLFGEWMKMAAEGSLTYFDMTRDVMIVEKTLRCFQNGFNDAPQGVAHMRMSLELPIPQESKHARSA